MRLPENHWYPVLESGELRRKPLGARRLGLDLVFWRDASGAAVVQQDRCPHLGAALSRGTVQDGCLTCPFHGMQFDGSGRCRHVPSMGSTATPPEVLRARTFPAREAHGFIWLWWGEAAPAAHVPFFDDLREGWTWNTTRVTWPVNCSRAIENQLDVAHLAFVHRTTIGAGGRSCVDGPHVESDATGIRVWVYNRRDDAAGSRSSEQLAALSRDRPPSLHLLFPGIWRLHISASFRNFIAFVPIDEGHVQYYLRSYLPRRWGVLGWLLHRLTRWSNRMVLDQDRRVVVTQTPPNSLDARDEHLVPADRAIIAYRRWLAGHAVER
jgi:phenylpropionate dioxygenase-like ring-hydroxylating dioxygenase large terminal subunit